MILKLLILALLVYLLLVVVYSSLRGRKGGAADSSRGESMVLDPHCKSYVPRNEAYQSKGHYFCSEECARAYVSQEA